MTYAQSHIRRRGVAWGRAHRPVWDAEDGIGWLGSRWAHWAAPTSALLGRGRARVGRLARPQPGRDQDVSVSECPGPISDYISHRHLLLLRPLFIPSCSPSTTIHPRTTTLLAMAAPVYVLSPRLPRRGSRMTSSPAVTSV